MPTARTHKFPSTLHGSPVKSKVHNQRNQLCCYAPAALTPYHECHITAGLHACALPGQSNTHLLAFVLLSTPTPSLGCPTPPSASRPCQDLATGHNQPPSHSRSPQHKPRNPPPRPPIHNGAHYRSPPAACPLPQPPPPPSPPMRQQLPHLQPHAQQLAEPEHSCLRWVHWRLPCGSADELSSRTRGTWASEAQLHVFHQDGPTFQRYQRSHPGAAKAPPCRRLGCCWCLLPAAASRRPHSGHTIVGAQRCHHARCRGPQPLTAPSLAS